MTKDWRQGTPLEAVDYKLVFDLMPGLCLVVDTAFNILAQNAEHARASLSTDKNVVGRYLFDAFPDNPYDSSASGVATRAPVIADRAEDAPGRCDADHPL